MALLFLATTAIISETVAQRCSVKKVFLEISQNSQENTCARDSPIEAGGGTNIPHREVVREDHVSTKLRIVFYCSAKNGNNVSFNETLGPYLIPQLFNLIIKFRLYPIALTGDVENIYRLRLIKNIVIILDIFGLMISIKKTLVLNITVFVEFYLV